MKVKQAYLVATTIDGEKITMTTWLDIQPALKEGAVVTLKDFPHVKWRVLELYAAEHDAQDFDFHRKWDNNNYDHHTGLGV